MFDSFIIEPQLTIIIHSIRELLKKNRHWSARLYLFTASKLNYKPNNEQAEIDLILGQITEDGTIDL